MDREKATAHLLSGSGRHERRQRTTRRCRPGGGRRRFVEQSEAVEASFEHSRVGHGSGRHRSSVVEQDGRRRARLVVPGAERLREQLAVLSNSFCSVRGNQGSHDALNRSSPRREDQELVAARPRSLLSTNTPLLSLADVPADVNSLPLHPELAEEEGEREGSERTRENALKRSESRRSAPRASRASGAGPRAGSKERKTHLLYHSGAALRTPTPSRSSSETRTTSGAEVETASTPTATGWGEVRVGRLDRASSHRHPERQHEQARAVGRRAAREMPTQRGRSAKRRVKRGAGPSGTGSGLAGRSARYRQLYVESRALSDVYDAVEGEGRGRGEECVRLRRLHRRWHWLRARNVSQHDPRTLAGALCTTERERNAHFVAGDEATRCPSLDERATWRDERCAVASREDKRMLAGAAVQSQR